MLKCQHPMPDFHFDLNTRIHYEERGLGTHPLVMLHGFGASHETWFDIAPYLSHYRLYLLDLRGFGLSSTSEHTGYSVRDHAQYVLAFIRRLGLSDCSLVGHSYGGIVATLAFLQAGSAEITLKALILIDAPVARAQFPLFVRALQVPLLGQLIVSCLPPSLQATFILRHLGHSSHFASKCRVNRYAKYFALPGIQRSLLETARALQLDRNLPLHCLGTFGNVLIIWGSQDPLFPISVGEEVCRLLPGSRFDVISACGHIPPEERPAATAKIIDNFMKTIGGSH